MTHQTNCRFSGCQGPADAGASQHLPGFSRLLVVFQLPRWSTVVPLACLPLFVLERTLLSAGLILISKMRRTRLRGGGQECPPYTGLLAWLCNPSSFA